MGFDSLPGITLRMRRFHHRCISRFTLLVFCLFTCTVLCCADPCWAQGAGAPKAKEGNFLGWLLQVSGPIGVFIFALSIYFAAVAFKQALELRMSVAAPPEVLQMASKYFGKRSESRTLNSPSVH